MTAPVAPLHPTASLRVMDKLGMVRKETNPAGYELRGQPIETHELEITASEWRAREMES